MTIITDKCRKINTTQRELYNLMAQGYSVEKLRTLMKSKCKTSSDRFNKFAIGALEATEQEFAYLLKLQFAQDYPTMSPELANYADKHGV